MTIHKTITVILSGQVLFFNVVFCSPLYTRSAQTIVAVKNRHSSKPLKSNMTPQATQTDQTKPENVETKNGTNQNETGTAQGPQAVNAQNSRESENNPLRKAARGAVNATLGWVEIPRQIVKTNKGKKDIRNILWGPVKGFSYFVTRTAVGIYEITTFLIPPYKPVVDPEFIFSDEEK